MSIPEGFKLVPVEPTAEILAELASDVYPDDNSAGKALQRLRGCDVVFPKYEVEAAVGKYQRMLASAPTPPQPIYDEAKERELFEDHYRKEFEENSGNELSDADIKSMRDGPWYGESRHYLNGQWAGWKARAKSVEVGDE